MRLVAAALALVLAPASYAWDLNGHRTVATIAYRTMKPHTRAWVDNLLRDFQPDGATAYRTFVGAATLADDFKHHPRNSTLKVVHKWDKWHYVDYQRAKSPDTVIEGQSPDATVVTALKRLVEQLKGHGRVVPDRDDAWALAMLIHFVGDVHQPMHGVDDHDSGGGKVGLKMKGARGTAKSIDLHSLWDEVATLNFKIAGPAGVDQAAAGIVAAFPRSGFGATRLGFAPEGWSKESFRYGVQFGYAAKPNKLQTDAYLANWKQKGFERIALAGYRLAALLDAIAPS